MDSYTTYRLAAAAGVSVHVVRDYVVRGLLHPARRTPGGYGLYGEPALARYQNGFRSVAPWAATPSGPHAPGQDTSTRFHCIHGPAATTTSPELHQSQLGFAALGARRHYHGYKAAGSG